MQHVVKVVFDSDARDLRIAGGDVTLTNERDSVVWIFDGIDSNHQPAIVFQDGNPMGPFASFDQLPHAVIGMGNTAAAGSQQRTYRAALIQSDSDPVESSNTATVTNPVTERYTPLTIDVAPDPADGRILRVVPEVAEIFSGQSVVWNFEGVSLNTYVPRIEFTDGPANAPPRGPFESLTLSQRNPAEPRDSAEPAGRYSAQIVGAVANRGVGISRYRILAVQIDGNGTLRTSPETDPQIDDMGPPPGGGEGGDGP